MVNKPSMNKAMEVEPNGGLSLWLWKAMAWVYRVISRGEV